MGPTLAYISAVLIALWGVAHAVPRENGELTTGRCAMCVIMTMALGSVYVG
jgi:hypothetical protein